MGSHLRAESKREKPQFLDEHCCNTAKSREYVIAKIHRAELSLPQAISTTYGQISYDSTVSCWVS